MTNSPIKVVGAREHNLKNIDFEIPRNTLTTLIGVSGSGKSTIAFDIIHAEGQRQYLDSVSTYAARILQKAERPDIDEIHGLSSTIMIEQRQLRGSINSTIGTATEVYTCLRLLFSRAGSKKLSASHFSFNNPIGACPTCGGSGFELTIDIKSLIDFNGTLNKGAIHHSLFKPGGRYMNILRTTGKIDFDKKLSDFSKEELDFLLYSPHTKIKNNDQGFVQSYSWEGIVPQLIKRSNDSRGISETKAKNDGLYWVKSRCSACNGYRLNHQSLSSLINDKNIGELSSLPLMKLKEELLKIYSPITKSIIDKALKSINSMIKVGIGYLSLDRTLDTLSGGEVQRVKLARELGNDLIEMIYILDEPTAGLHPRDIQNLISILQDIRNSQNTVLVVEHNAEVIKASDYILELGPGAGKFGGNIIASGSPNDIINNPNSITAEYLSRNGLKTATRRKPKGFIKIANANLHNLKGISVNIPTGVFTAVTGVSGSGKSTLINDIFAKENSDKITFVDQSPVGSTPRANIATYSGAFTHIRKKMAQENNVDESLFSFNSDGACPDCNGLGYKKINMHFMADVKVPCETCEGKKFKPETLKYRYKGKNINEILAMTATEAVGFFNDKEIVKRIQMLCEVGLDYLELGQTLDTLSGGESQRLKLASKLHQKNEFYVMDEPTAGLHFADIKKLIKLINRLVDQGNSVLVIEHNLDMMKNADWIIDMGPEGGDQGGQIIAEGTPEDIAKVKTSYTGQFLAKDFSK